MTFVNTCSGNYNNNKNPDPFSVLKTVKELKWLELLPGRRGYEVFITCVLEIEGQRAIVNHFNTIVESHSGKNFVQFESQDEPSKQFNTTSK